MVTTNTAIRGKNSATRAPERRAESRWRVPHPCFFKHVLGLDILRVRVLTSAACFGQAGRNFLRPGSKYAALLLRQPEGLFGWDEFDWNSGDERF